MTIKVKDAEVYKPILDARIKDGGSYKQVKEIWKKADGNWNKYYSLMKLYGLHSKNFYIHDGNYYEGCVSIMDTGNNLVENPNIVLGQIPTDVTFTVDNNKVFIGNYSNTTNTLLRNVGGLNANGYVEVDPISGVYTGGLRGTNVLGGSVVTSLVSGNTIYLGGTFTSILGSTRNAAAAIDATSGSVLQWDPNCIGFITALATREDYVYLGGGFTSVGGVARNRLAAVDSISGSLLGWTPGITSTSTINVIHISGGSAYVGGTFSNVSGVSRTGAAAFDTISGSLLMWNPVLSPSPQVYDIKTYDNTVLIVGTTFTTCNGVSRGRGCAVDPISGTTQTWNLNVSSQGNCIAISGDRFYVAYQNGFAGGVRAYDKATQARITSFQTTFLPATYAYKLYPANNKIYMMGTFISITGNNRFFLAASDPISGADSGYIDQWNSGNSIGCYGYTFPYQNIELLQNGNLFISYANLYSVNSTTLRTGGACYDLSADTWTEWNPNTSLGIYSIAISGSTAFIGGSFTAVGGVTRNRAAAVDTISGSPLSWNPNANGSVYALLTNDNTIYIAGNFTTMNGSTTRNRAAAVDPVSGIINIWNPNFQSFEVRCIALSGASVYAGGAFTSAGGQPRNMAAAVDSISGSLLPWNPNFPSSTVRTILPIDNIVYVGGNFSSAGGFSRSRVAAVDPVSGSILSFVADCTSANSSTKTVYGIQKQDSKVFIAGTNIDTINDFSRTNFGIVDDISGTAVGGVRLVSPGIYTLVKKPYV